MTKYYCRANICRTNHKARKLCCWNCLNMSWCDSMGEWKGCNPWTCGKSIRISDYYWRYFARIGYLEWTGKTAFPLRKLKKKLIANRRKILRGETV